MKINIEHIIIYTLPPTVTSIGAIVVAWMSARAGKRNEQKLHSIDRAVNKATTDETP